jgi:hypothetical protein
MKRRFKIVLSVLGILVLTGIVLAIWLLMPEEMIKPDMVRQEQSSFVYYYEPQDRANAEKLMRVLDQDHAHITQTLDWHPSTKTTVVMYSEQSEFQRAARGRISDYLGADWFIGDNRADAVLIMSPGIPNRTNGPDEIVQAAAHEYVHMVEDNINKDLPIYWHEGIAMYLAGQKVKGRIYTNGLPDANKVFKTGLNMWTSLEFGNTGGYQLSYTLVEYVAQEFGSDKLAAIVRDPSRPEQVFGKSYDALYDGWVAYLAKNYW